MSKILNVTAAIVILATGVVKVEAAPKTVESDCIPRANAAFATVRARDMGQSDRDLYRYVDSNKGQVEYRPIYKRIIFTAYSNHSLTPDSAYNGEYTKCLGEVQRNTFSDKKSK